MEIPAFTCKSGCHDCCGLVPFLTPEKDRVAAIRPLEQWEHFGGDTWVLKSALQTFTCPFITAGGCGIYDVRPIVCKLFGAVDVPTMQCPHGAAPATMLSDEQARGMIDAASGR